MAKVLLVDTNFSSRPIYEAIEKLGHEVHVIGSNPNDCLAKSSSKYWKIDYSDISALDALLQKEGFDFLVPGCTDASYSSCATVSNGHFPGVESAEIDKTLNQKDCFRVLAQKLNLCVPHMQWADIGNAAPPPDEAKLDWPLIVKPVDAFSGKGISVLRQPNSRDLMNSISKARQNSKSNRCLIESFIEGQLYSHSAFLMNKQIIDEVFVEEHCITNPFVVDTSYIPPEISPSIKFPLRSAIEKIAQTLSLSDGLIHTQFIYDGNHPWLIEITRRCPGDLYSQLIELNQGKGYIESYIRPYLGLSINPRSKTQYHPIIRHTITTSKPQRLSHLKFLQPLLIEQWTPIGSTGDQLNPSPGSRVGILFIKSSNIDHLTTILQSFKTKNVYKIE